MHEKRRTTNGRRWRAALAAVFVALMLWRCGEEPGKTAPPAPAPVSEKPSAAYAGTIVAVGDSLTEGLGLSEEEAARSVRLLRRVSGLAPWSSPCHSRSNWNRSSRR